MFESALCCLFHHEHCRVATCDSVVQPMLVVLYVTCFVVFSQVFCKGYSSSVPRVKSYCQRCVLEGGEARTKSLGAVRNLTLRKVTMTVVKQWSCWVSVLGDFRKVPGWVLWSGKSKFEAVSALTDVLDWRTAEVLCSLHCSVILTTFIL